MNRERIRNLRAIVIGVLMAIGPVVIMGGCERSLEFALDDVAGASQVVFLY